MSAAVEKISLTSWAVLAAETLTSGVRTSKSFCCSARLCCMLRSALSRAPKQSSGSVCSSHRWLFKARGPKRRGPHHRSSELGVTSELSSHSDAAPGASGSGTGRSGATGCRFFNATESQIYFPWCSHPQSLTACQGEREQGTQHQFCALQVQGTRAMPPGACMSCAAWPLGSGTFGLNVELFAIHAHLLLCLLLPKHAS
jgi:hypothetical protein